MGRYKLGNVSFATREDKENYQLIGLLQDYIYLHDMNEDKLSEGDKEIFKHLNKQLTSLLRQKMKAEKSTLIPLMEDRVLKRKKK